MVTHGLQQKGRASYLKLSRMLFSSDFFWNVVETRRSDYWGRYGFQTSWSLLAAVLRCEDPKCVPRVGCIITPVECVGAPLICSRLTESGPVSEAAQAALMNRLTAFELLSITTMEAGTWLMQRNYGPDILESAQKS